MAIKTIILSGFVILLTLFIFQPAQILSAAESLQAQSIGITAFVNVNVIPMDTERVIENQTVIVEGDRITTIGPVDEVAVPDNAEVVEGNGAYLMPGLADMHVHLNYDSDPAYLRLYLANGVTTIRSLNTIVPDFFNWREQVANGSIQGPTIYTSGNAIAGVPAELSRYPLLFRAGTVLLPILICVIIWLIIWLLSKFTPVISNFEQIRRFILPSLAATLLIGVLVTLITPLTTLTMLH